MTEEEEDSILRTKLNTNFWSYDFDESDTDRKINQSTIQSYKAKVPKIEIKRELLITTIFLEIKIERFWEKIASNLSFNIDNLNVNIL